MSLDRHTKEFIIDMIDKKIDSTALMNVLSTKNPHLGTVTNIMRQAISKTNICEFSGTLHFYNGKYYERMEQNEFSYILNEIMDKRSINSIYGYRVSIVKACLQKAVGNNVTSVPNNLVCFSNGVIDFDSTVKDIDLRPHHPRYSVFYMLPYPYVPDAKCPLWEKFLDEVLPDKSLQMNLQEYLGLIFVNRASHNIETMMWLHGSGANGKSVVFNVIMGVLGQNNTSNFDIKDLISGPNKERNLAAINSKLLNYCSDVDSKVINSDAIKPLISGEPMIARPIYSGPITVHNIPLMMANSNRIPKNKDRSDAWIRRLRPIPFEVTIPDGKQDKTLSQKLKREYSGILNWILRGRDRIVKNNFLFTYSERIESFLKAYKENNSSVASFLETYDILPYPTQENDVGKVILSSDFYFRYLEWCDRSSIPVDERFGNKAMSSELLRLGYHKSRTGAGVVFRYFGYTGF